MDKRENAKPDPNIKMADLTSSLNAEMVRLDNRARTNFVLSTRNKPEL